MLTIDVSCFRIQLAVAFVGCITLMAKRKAITKTTYLVILSGVVLFLLLAVLWPFVWVLVGFGFIRLDEAYLRKPRVYEPVAKTLALYCQSDSNLVPEQIDYAWFPAPLREKGRGRGRIFQKGAAIEMGGGFHHHGYRLVFDESATDSLTNVWQLYLYSEGSKDEPLFTLRLANTEELSADELLNQALCGYEEHLAVRPNDLSAHKARIQLYLQYNRISQARRACRDLLRALPDDWWANLVNALVIAEEESSAEGERHIQGWVNSKPNFFRYTDLAYYYQLSEEPKKAAEAMLKATQHNANTTWGHGGNSEFRGYTAAMYAFESGEYHAVVKLCEKLIPVTINGDYAKRGLRNLRAAANAALRGEPREVVWDDTIAPFDPFEEVDIQALLRRKVERPTQEEYYREGLQ